MAEEIPGDQEKNMAIHIICPLAPSSDQGEFTVFCGLAPRNESFPQFGILTDNGGSTSAAPALVESTGYHCRWTKINDNSINNLARRLTNVVIPMINQKFDIRIPTNDLVNESNGPGDSTYIKMSCEEHKVVDYHDDRTTRYMRMPSFGETDKTVFETVASTETLESKRMKKIGLSYCSVCGYVSGNCILSKLVDFMCKELRRNGMKIAKEPQFKLNATKPQALVFIN